MWQPEGDKGRAVPVAAWAEEGKPMSVPGPLIRVPAGTDVKATLKNSLDKPLFVFGFGKTRGMSDSVVIPAGASRDVQFKATAPGTYYYVAHRGMTPLGIRAESDMELVGAIVVDAPGRRAERPRVHLELVVHARRQESHGTRPRDDDASTGCRGRTPSASTSRRATPSTGA